MGFGSSKRKKHSKLGCTTLRAYHFRLETNHTQSSKLHQSLDLAWELRNQQALMLETTRLEARAAKQRGDEPVYLSALDLKKAVASKTLDVKFAALHSQVRQDLSLRISEGQQRWFEAIKKGLPKVKPPGAIARKHFRSITYPQYGTAAQIKNGKLFLSKLGEYRVIGWRKMRGAKKSVTIKFKEGHWWAIVMCQVQLGDVCRPYQEVKDLPEAGIDPGISAVLTDSYGNSYATPKPLKAAKAKLRHIQKDVSRKFEVRKKLHLQTLATARASGRDGCKAPVAQGLVESLRTIPYSNRLKCNIRKLARAHTKVERIRTDVTRKNARRIEQRFARVAVEDHGLVFILKNRRLAKAASDVAIGSQKKSLQSAMGKVNKAGVGRYFDAANRRPEGGNSQTCLCGAAVAKTLKVRWHHCPDCGLQAPRDQVSAIICQHTTFGSVPAIKLNSAPGLGVLEQAISALEKRRGESKGGCGESRPAESPAVAASELSVKRLAQRVRSMRPTTGAVQKTASVEVKTMGHAGSARSWPVETTNRVINEQPPILIEAVSRFMPRSTPPSGG